MLDLRKQWDKARDPRPLFAVVKMKGFQRCRQRHYFNLEDDLMQEIIDGWVFPMWTCSRPTSSPFAPILQRTTMMPPLFRSRSRHAALVSEHRVLPLALIARSPFALLPRRAEVLLLRSRPKRSVEVPGFAEGAGVAGGRVMGWFDS